MSIAIKESGVAVRVFKRSGNAYYCAFRIQGRKFQRSTGEETVDRAKASAREIVREELRKELLDMKPGPTLTLSAFFSAYFRDRVPQLQPDLQQASWARRELLETCFGADKNVSDLDQADVNRFIHERTRGTLYPTKQTAKRKTVSVGTAKADLSWLRTAFKWGMGRRIDGTWLIESNPLDRLKLPKMDEERRRPVASETRYRRTLAEANGIDPRGRIRAMVAIARYTGRRIESICALRASLTCCGRLRTWRTRLQALGQDVRLAEHYPHGAIRWRAEADKINKNWITPITPDLLGELQRFQATSPSIGDAPLFPAPRKPTAHFDSDLAGKWLVRVEEKAKLPKLAGGRWHPYRRLFATELVHVPAKVAAMLGGWKNPATMQRLYQHPEGADIYAAAQQIGRKTR